MRAAIAILWMGCAHPGATAGPVGTWRGTSTCLVKPSACHDETVVYHIAQHGDSLAATANKIVDGNEVSMGELTCTWSEPTLRCAIDKGVFTYVIDGDHMTGKLELTDGTRFRTIDVRRVR